MINVIFVLGLREGLKKNNGKSTFWKEFEVSILFFRIFRVGAVKIFNWQFIRFYYY